MNPPDKSAQRVGQDQRGRLSLSRYAGQSVLVYPRDSFLQVTAQELFSEPLTFLVDRVENDSVYLRIVADTRLVVVRDEIFKRNGRQFAPSPALRSEAFRRVFYELAKATLNEHVFTRLSDNAWRRVLNDGT